MCALKTCQYMHCLAFRCNIALKDFCLQLADVLLISFCESFFLPTCCFSSTVVSVPTFSGSYLCLPPPDLYSSMVMSFGTVKEKKNLRVNSLYSRLTR